MLRPIPGPHSPPCSSQLGPEASFGVDPGPIFPTPGEGRCKEGVFRLEPGWEVLGGRVPHEWGTRGPGDAMRKVPNVLVRGEEVSESREKARRSQPCGGIAGGVCEQEAGGQRECCGKPDRPSGCLTPTCGPSCLPPACWDPVFRTLHPPCPSVPTRCAVGGGHDAQRQGLVGVDPIRSSAGHLQGTRCPWRELVGLPRGHGSPRRRWWPEDLGSGWLGSCCLSHQVTSP